MEKPKQLKLQRFPRNREMVSVAAIGSSCSLWHFLGHRSDRWHVEIVCCFISWLLLLMGDVVDMVS